MEKPLERIISVRILLIPILHHRLPIMTFLAQRLPVPFIPKQRRIPSMGFNMIDNCRLGVPAFFHTPYTQWMSLNECFTSIKIFK